MRAAASLILFLSAGCWAASTLAPPAPRMSANHWIGPKITPQQYLDSNRGLYEVDKDGVLVTLYRDRSEQTSARIEYNPAFIANYAIAACREYVLTGANSAAKTLHAQLSWLLGHAEHRQVGERVFRRYPYTFEWVKYKLSPPWVSGFAQALIGTAFACGADSTGDPSYSDAAVETFSALLVSTDGGGVTTFGSNTAWFEEAAREDFPSIKILNGHLTAMEGLKSFIDWRPDAEFADLYRKAVNGTRALLRSFDAGYLSYYDHFPPNMPQEWGLSGRVGYNSLHIIQLTNLYQVTGDSYFLRYALRFAEYESPLYLITTSGSTSPRTNGPDRINMVLGNDYWSHSVFPTSVVVDLGDVFQTYGISLVAHTEQSTPRDFLLSVSIDGVKFRPLRDVRRNISMRRTIGWAQAPARYVRLDILSDNGNKNVTLKGVYVHRREKMGAAVAVATAMSVGNMPGLAFSRHGWRPPASGWLIFRRSALPGGLRSAMILGASSGVIKINASDTPDGLKARIKAVQLRCSANPCRVPIPDGEGDFVLVEWTGLDIGPDSRLVLSH